MTLFEIIYFNRELIKRLQSAGAKFGDCRNIELYIEYMIMLNRGDKVTYIVSFLSEKYAVSERKIYSIIKRFGTRCTYGAA
jgi:Mor family transcriptional regulator